MSFIYPIKTAGKKKKNNQQTYTQIYNFIPCQKQNTDLGLFIEIFYSYSGFYQVFCYSLHDSGLEEIVLCQNPFLTNHHSVALG